MSLKENVLVIAEAMEDEANHFDENNANGKLFRSYARQIRIAVKHYDEDSPDFALSMGTKEAEQLKRRLLKQAQREVEEAKIHVVQQEHGASVAYCVGGGSDGVMAPVHGMPIGARCFVGSEVYERRSDGHLHHIPPAPPESKIEVP